MKRGFAAVKISRFPSRSEGSGSALASELLILRRLRSHPNVVRPLCKELFELSPSAEKRCLGLPLEHLSGGTLEQRRCRFRGGPL